MSNNLPDPKFAEELYVRYRDMEHASTLRRELCELLFRSRSGDHQEWISAGRPPMDLEPKGSS